MKILISKHSRTIISAVGESAYRDYLGRLITPNARGIPVDEIKIGAMWAVDNAAFRSDRFDARVYIRTLKALSPFSKSCSFVAVPDVVGDSELTLHRFKLWYKAVSYLGFPLAFVAQDGIELRVIPWDDFNCLFIGGTTEWKLSYPVIPLIKEAHRRGKWVHMGRVNSVRRIRYAMSLNIDSVDGTGFSMFSISTLSKVLPVFGQSHQMNLWEGT